MKGRCTNDRVLKGKYPCDIVTSPCFTLFLLHVYLFRSPISHYVHRGIHQSLLSSEFSRCICLSIGAFLVAFGNKVIRDRPEN
jgi:hypothetical protein